MALLAEQLSGIGIEVSVASWASADVEDAYALPPRVKRIHLRRREQAGSRPARLLAHLVSVARLVRVIRRSSLTAVISFSEASNFLCVLAGRIANVPVIASIRADPEAIFMTKPRWRRFSLWSYRRADAVVVQTAGVAQWCKRHCGRDGQVVPNALRALPPTTRQGRSLVIVAVGRLDFLKGQDLLIRAFAGLHRDYPAWRLLILGEGERMHELQQLANELGVAAKIEFRGFVKQVETEIDACSIFALSTRSEGFPNALLEAMGMGLACVTTDCDYGPAEIVTHGQDGLLVPVEDVAALELALRSLIEDEALRERLGANAMTVRERFDGAAIAERWTDCVRMVSRERLPAGASHV